MLSRYSLVLPLLAVALCIATPIDQPTANSSSKPPSVELSTPGPDDVSWFNMPFFTNFFAPLFKWFPSFNDFGPNVFAGDKNFQVSIPVKDYPKESLKVKTLNGFVTIQGTQQHKPGEKNVFASQFFHTYSLPINASDTELTAELSSDNYLTVSVPITTDGPGHRSSKEVVVEIKETGKPYEKPKEEPASAAGSPPNSSAPVIPDKKNEVTPRVRDREEVTEANSIPHGNDALNTV